MYLNKTQIAENQTKYFAGFLESLSQHEDNFENICRTQLIDKKSFDLLESIDSPRTILEITKKDFNYEENKIFFLQANINGMHSIGGKCPEDFILPTPVNIRSPFVYLGTIDTKDNHFSWLGIDNLHICYPIFEGSFQIFLDYSDPLIPQVINPEVFTYSWITNEAVTQNGSEICYSQSKYTSTNTISNESIAELRKTASKSIFPDSEFETLFNRQYIQCGAPYWLQEIAIPTNPLSAESMRYVTMIHSESEKKSLNLNITSGWPFADEYLSFGDMGKLYIFFDQITKIACIEMQF